MIILQCTVQKNIKESGLDKLEKRKISWPCQESKQKSSVIKPIMYSSYYLCHT